MMTPEGYSCPRQRQSWSFEAELVLKPSVRRNGPRRAIGAQEQEEEKAEQGLWATDRQHCEGIWCLGPWEELQLAGQGGASGTGPGGEELVSGTVLSLHP